MAVERASYYSHGGCCAGQRAHRAQGSGAWASPTCSAQASSPPRTPHRKRVAPAGRGGKQNRARRREGPCLTNARRARRHAAARPGQVRWCAMREAEDMGVKRDRCRVGRSAARWGVTGEWGPAVVGSVVSVAWGAGCRRAGAARDGMVVCACFGLRGACATACCGVSGVTAGGEWEPSRPPMTLPAGALRQHSPSPPLLVLLAGIRLLPRCSHRRHPILISVVVIKSPLI